MGCVAYRAAFNPHRLMLIDKWPALIGVTVVADLSFRDRCAQLMRSFRAVRVMAIRALDETFIHPMPERHRELRFLLLMTAIAQLRLCLGEQELTRFRVMYRMAGGARNIVPGMERIDDVKLLRGARMAVQTAGIRLFRASLGEKE